MLGLAVGDALGLPAEFLGDLALIKGIYGPDGITDFADTEGTFTDDTEMSIATARALFDAASPDVGQVMRAVSRRYAEWRENPGWSPGRACLEGAARLAEGVDWTRSGDPNAKGCGTAMRTAPIGLRYPGDEPRIVEIALAVSRCTHGHACALAGGVATAALVDMALAGVPPEAMHERLRAIVAPISEEFLARWDQVPDAMREDPADVCDLLGEGWVAEEAVAAAFWCFWKSPNDYTRAALRAVNSRGDSDSLGCIAGAISGAYLGEEAIPKKWRLGVARADELVALAEDLYDAAAGPHA